MVRDAGVVFLFGCLLMVSLFSVLMTWWTT